MALLARLRRSECERGRAAAILALVGVINLPIIKFSVDWWNTLHQPASSLASTAPAIHSIRSSMPLLLDGMAGCLHRTISSGAGACCACGDRDHDERRIRRSACDGMSRGVSGDDANPSASSWSANG
jgi:hypothetical protein